MPQYRRSTSDHSARCRGLAPHVRFGTLARYARDRAARHWPAWVDFNRRMKDARGDVGIWHETYKMRAGEYESIYSGMSPHGLGKAADRAAVTEASDSARQRLELQCPDRH